MRKSSGHPKHETVYSSPQKKHSTRRPPFPYFAVGFVIVFCFILAVLYNNRILGRKQSQVVDFITCQKAGYPVMESYPAACKGPDGKIYTEQISPLPTFPDADSKSPSSMQYNAPISPTGYYGTSTKGNCIIDTDCSVTGCNSEICQSKNDKTMMSICLAPLGQTYSEAGYECKCVEKKCQWTK